MGFGPRDTSTSVESVIREGEIPLKSEVVRLLMFMIGKPEWKYSQVIVNVRNDSGGVYHLPQLWTRVGGALGAGRAGPDVSPMMGVEAVHTISVADLRPGRGHCLAGVRVLKTMQLN